MEILDRRVEQELDELAPDVRQRFLRIAELIERHGPAAVHEPYVKHLEGKLWEMRMKGRDGIARAIMSTRRKENESCAPRVRQEVPEDAAAEPWRLHASAPRR